MANLMLAAILVVLLYPYLRRQVASLQRKIKGLRRRYDGK